MDIKRRIRNPLFILGLAGLVIPYLLQLGFKFDSNYVMNLIDGLCKILVFIGIMIDPTSPGFKDTDK